MATRDLISFPIFFLSSSLRGSKNNRGRDSPRGNGSSSSPHSFRLTSWKPGGEKSISISRARGEKVVGCSIARVAGWLYVGGKVSSTLAAVAAVRPVAFTPWSSISPKCSRHYLGVSSPCNPIFQLCVRALSSPSLSFIVFLGKVQRGDLFLRQLFPLPAESATMLLRELKKIKGRISLRRGKGRGGGTVCP